MKLYHGTSGAALDKILKRGLTPRGKRKGNWGEHPSNPECVYLSDTYAPYYAICAASGAKQECAVLEIDTDALNDIFMLPDEDFLEQGTRNDPSFPVMGQPIGDRTRYFREHLINYGHVWQDSLKHLGTCCHLGPIPNYAITRVATFNLKDDIELAMHFDPVICLANYAICADDYRARTAHLFGDPIPKPITEFGRQRAAAWRALRESQPEGSVGDELFKKNNIVVRNLW